MAFAVVLLRVCRAMFKQEQKTLITKNEFTEEDYYFRLLNLFIQYYNEKFNKKDNFFSNNIKNVGNLETTNQMELFFEAIIEYKNLKKKLNLDDIDCMKYYYEEVNYEKNIVYSSPSFHRRITSVSIKEDTITNK